jgi:hypothetical protein
MGSVFGVSKASQYLRDAMGGQNLSEIGRRNGISRQAVDQAIRKHFGKSYSAIAKARSIELATERAANKAAHDFISATNSCQKTYLCSVKQYESSLSDSFSQRRKNAIAKRYREQCRNAKRRGVEWSVPLPLWLSLLSESGRLNDPDWVIGRRDYSKGFTPENIEAKTSAQCSSDSTKCWQKARHE